MMKIEKIEVDGFANLNDVTLEFGSLTYLLSRNNFGKSNVIKAIDSASAILNNKGSFTGSDSFKRFAPLCEADYHRPFLFKLFGKSRIEGKEVEFSYSFSFDWGEDEGDPFFTKESLDVRPLDSQKFSNFFSRSGTDGTIRKKAEGRTETQTTIDNKTLLLYKMSLTDGVDYLDLIKEILGFQVFVDNGLNSSPFFGLDAILPHLSFSAKPNSIIPAILATVKDQNAYSRIVNAMKDLFPNTTDFSLHRVEDPAPSPNQQKAPATYFLSIGQKHIKAPLDISLMSDGFQRVLSAFVCLTNADGESSKIVCLEEPENCINPALLKNYITLIEQFAGNNRILISSHSPFLASYIDPKQIYVGLPEDDGLANFRPFKETGVERLSKAAADNEYLFGEYIFNLLAGDEENLKFLRKNLV